MTEWTTVNLEVPTAKRLKKSAIDAGENTRNHATHVVELGLRALRESRRNNITTSQQSQALNKP